MSADRYAKLRAVLSQMDVTEPWPDEMNYLSAASPATIAALLAEHDRLLIENRNLRATIGWAANMTAAGNRKVNPAGDLLDNLNITLRAALSAGEAIGFVTHETKE